MANPLEVTELARDLIAFGKGLPSGSIDVGDLSVDDLAKEAQELVSIITVASWALIGTVVTAYLEHDAGDVVLAKRMPHAFHAFPWTEFRNYEDILSKIIDIRADRCWGIHPKVYYNALRLSKSATMEERSIVLRAALQNHWNPTTTSKIVYELSHRKNYSPGMGDVLLEAIKTLAARKGDLLDAYDEAVEGVPGGDVAELNKDNGE